MILYNGADTPAAAAAAEAAAAEAAAAAELQAFKPPALLGSVAASASTDAAPVIAVLETSDAVELLLSLTRTGVEAIMQAACALLEVRVCVLQVTLM